MISVDFVNGTIASRLELAELSRPYFEASYEAEEMIESAYASLSILHNKIETEELIFGESTQKTNDEFMVESGNFFEGIGRALEKVIQAFIDFCNKTVDKIKSRGLLKKSEYAKLDILITKHPNYRDELVAAFNDRTMDLKDIKSLAELDKEFERVMEMLRAADVDPNTIRGKWEKAKKKFNDDSKNWKFMKIAGAVTTGITAILAVKTFKSKCLAASSSTIKDREAITREKNRIYDDLQELKSSGSVKDAKQDEVFRMKLRIWQEWTGCHQAAIGENYSFLERLAVGMANTADKISNKVDKNRSDRYEKNMEGKKRYYSKKDEEELNKSKAKKKSDLSATDEYYSKTKAKDSPTHPEHNKNYVYQEEQA